MDVKSEMPNQIYKKTYTLSPRQPFNIKHTILDHDEQHQDVCISNLTFENMTGVIIIRKK